MEEQRIGMMYVNMFKRRITRLWDGLFPRGLFHSSLAFLLLIAAIVLVPSLGWYLHTRAKFRAIKNDIGVTQVQVANVPRPGNADPIELRRTQTPGDNTPEFLSATILPGLGMDVLQITASLPGRGETRLLEAPSIQDMADGTLPPRAGINDSHGAIEVPFGGAVSGLISPLGSALTATWRGDHFDILRDPKERTGMKEGGMLLNEGVDSVQVTPTSTGSSATGEFRSTDFSGHWPGKTNVVVTVQLGQHAIDLTVTAKNIGTDPQPMGIGWHPRFTIPSGDRGGAELRLPMGERLEIPERLRAVPSGRAIPLGEILSKFVGHNQPLGSFALDDAMVHLKSAALDAGSAVEFRDPASGYALRMTAVSASIRELRLAAPDSATYLSMGMQTNYDDPFGKEWAGEEVPPIVTLAPGQSLEWKVRLEILPVTGK